jgi:hypothetical protein
MPENQLLAKNHVTLVLMVLSGLFRLYELVQARTSLYKLKKVLCKFTDEADKDNKKCGKEPTQSCSLQALSARARRSAGDSSKREGAGDARVRDEVDQDR